MDLKDSSCVSPRYNDKKPKPSWNASTNIDKTKPKVSPASSDFKTINRDSILREVNNNSGVLTPIKQCLNDKKPKPSWNASTKIDKIKPKVSPGFPDFKKISGDSITTQVIKDVDVFTPIKQCLNDNKQKPPWNSSTKIYRKEEIKALPSMTNYRKKMQMKWNKGPKNLERIIRAKLNNITEKKNEGLRLIKLMMNDNFKMRNSDRSSVDGFKNVPALGNEEAFRKKYECTDFELGSGGSCSVFQGIRRSDSVQVAIKKVKKSHGSYWGLVSGAYQWPCQYPIEYCMLHKLQNCEGVIQLLDGFETDEEFIWILELVENCLTLEDYIWGSSPLHESYIKTFFKDLLHTVEACHQKGVYHRDLKEANILVDLGQDGCFAKLIDFDIASSVECSPFWENPGTPGYMAPEMFRMSKRYDGLPAAIYSLGVILYDMVFGAVHWELVDDDSKLTGLPILQIQCIQCLDLIDSMLECDPQKRPTIQQILDHSWLNSLN